MTYPQATERILIYRMGQLGDTIIALPALWAVRRYFHSAHLTLLASYHANTTYVSSASVLPTQGLLDSWFTYPSRMSGVDPRVFPSLLRALRRGQFDTLVYLVPRLRSNWQVLRDLIFFRLAGIRHFVGHRGFAPLPRVPRTTPLPGLEHEADHLLNRLSLSGIPIPEYGVRSMNLQLTDEERGRAVAWLRSCLGKHFDHVPIAAIAPGSKWPSKVWPEERFAMLGRRLIEDLGMYPIVFGGPEDRDTGQRLIAEWGQGANAAGVLDVRAAAASLELCRFSVSNDTGTMHLAAAVGTPCVAIFSAQDWPGRWYPYGGGHLVLRRSVPCEGCRLEICGTEKMRCLRLIEVEDVYRSCKQICKAKPPINV